MRPIFRIFRQFPSNGATTTSDRESVTPGVRRTASFNLARVAAGTARRSDAGSMELSSTRATMDTNPGWNCVGYWGLRELPPGDSPAIPRPGHTGSKVVGYNLNGAYHDNLSSPCTPQLLRSTALGIRESRLASGAGWELRGRPNDNARSRFLTTAAPGPRLAKRQYDHQRNGPGTSRRRHLRCGQRQIHGLHPLGMGPTNSSVTYCGWNIDDVTLTGSVAPPVVTDANITIASVGSGTNGTDKIGDTVTATVGQHDQRRQQRERYRRDNGLQPVRRA